MNLVIFSYKRDITFSHSLQTTKRFLKNILNPLLLLPLQRLSSSSIARLLLLLQLYMTSRIYPSEIQVREEGAQVNDKVVEWTVWKKSTMSFIGSDGFSVFDREGRLAFRVDNYSRRSKFLLGQLLLMDAIGRPLISLRPQILSMHGQWKGYRDDGGSSKTRSNSNLFTMRRRTFSQSKQDAVDVFLHCGGSASAEAADFRIEGCFRKRCCKIRGRDGDVLALISPKKASPSVVLGDDVFSLSVKEGVPVELMVAFIIVMDRVC